jgi:hypothetical protein
LLQPNPFPSSLRDRVLTTAFKSHATRKASNTPLWYVQIMFRVRDAVKFGASRVCPMCNSGHRRSLQQFSEGER